MSRFKLLLGKKYPVSEVESTLELKEETFYTLFMSSTKFKVTLSWVVRIGSSREVREEKYSGYHGEKAFTPFGERKRAQGVGE